MPTFDGEAKDEKLGLGARSYQMQAWLQCTRLPEQRALPCILRWEDGLGAAEVQAPG